MLKKEKYDGFFGGLYKRNEIYLLLSTAILLISVLLGYAFAGLLSPFLAGMLSSLKNNAVQGQIQLQTLPIFEKNLDIILIIYIGGILFGVGTAIYLIFNGIFNGYAATQFPLGNYILYNIPYGIPEFVGIIISGAAGFRLASCIYHIFNGLTHMRSDISQTNQFRYIIEMNMDEFWESIKLLVIAIVFLLIAAFIEANLSIAWANYIKTAI
ncbi:MAG: stage II sporulation protein M [Methanobacterium sp.]|uniref:stage II sporulation protein M n=1 Tax=Methanobacterium sp. TaxID=2164 RepID=UPI003C7678B6